MAAQCPTCGHNGMLFDDLHGMECNVCEQCGTVIESVPLVMDVYESGTSEVSSNFQHKTLRREKGLLNPDLKPFAESKEIMCHLMDRLNIPIPARELALQFLQYTKSFNKRSSVGACVYLAMKRHDIPITIKYISNYLQVSHYLIGKVMKKLEKRIGPSAQSNAFSVDRLLHLIFSEAKFGGNDGGKKRLDLLLSRTELLLQLLQECQVSVSYHPHIIILAAGYCVWRNLVIHGWKGLMTEKGKDYSCLPSVGKATIKAYLEEVGVQLSDLSSLMAKVNLFCATLKNCARHIPWLPNHLTKGMVFIHLGDFLKYKPQIVALAARDMPKEQNIKEEDLSEESFRSHNHEGLQEQYEGDKVNETIVGNKDVCSSNVNSNERNTFAVSLGDDVGFGSILMKAEPNEEVRNSSLYRKVKFTKLTNLRQCPHEKLKVDLSDSCERVGEKK